MQSRWTLLKKGAKKLSRLTSVVQAINSGDKLYTSYAIASIASILCFKSAIKVLCSLSVYLAARSVASHFVRVSFATSLVMQSSAQPPLRDESAVPPSFTRVVLGCARQHFQHDPFPLEASLVPRKSSDQIPPFESANSPCATDAIVVCCARGKRPCGLLRLLY